MGFTRVAKRRSGGLGGAWGPQASRPTPRTILPQAHGRLPDPVRFEAQMAEHLVGSFDAITAMLSTPETRAALGADDWVAIADFVDWANWETEVHAGVDPIIRATIQREGAKALAEVIRGSQAETSLAVRATGAVPPIVPPDDPGIPAAPTPRSGGFYATARFDMTNPFAVASAERFGAGLVRQVSRSTRLAIRDTIVTAFREGVTVDVTARRLRETIGLTRAQSRAVANFRARMEAQGLDESMVDRATRRYYRRTLKRRAETIARTEIMAASNHGRMEAYRSAGDAGLLDLGASTKEWITAPERSRYGPPCKACLPLDGVKVLGVESEFSLPDGTRLLNPPAHPNCRCTVVVWPPEPPEDWDPEYPHAQV